MAAASTGRDAAVALEQAHQLGDPLGRLVERGHEVPKRGAGEPRSFARSKTSCARSTALDTTKPETLWPVSAAARRSASSCSAFRRKFSRPVSISDMYVPDTYRRACRWVRRESWVSAQHVAFVLGEKDASLITVVSVDIGIARPTPLAVSLA